MQATLNIAIEAAREAGKIIFRNMSRVHSLNIKTKEKNDFVSEVDLQAEQEIINVIHRVYPQHGILAEESGSRFSGKDDEYQWIIDPLDGTTNFLRGFPHYSVSIALKHNDRLEVAVIYDPFKDELFCAGRGNGASLNDRKIRVSKLPSFDGALLATGFPYKENQNIDTYMTSLKDIMLQTSGIRRAGSAALDLAYVAAGRVDGFWEFGLNTWDIAAGCLIIQEAGGLVGDPEGGHTHLETGNIVAANTKIFRQILQSLNKVN
ncbi:MAG: inositol monophosphatase [Gammaproteobacteria bacterium]|nr:MAG: inositol monophosphatase [Gammaproteobacteria bacterium]